MVSIDNKNSYFRITFEFDIKNSHVSVEDEMTKLKEKIDIFLTKVSASEDYFEIRELNNKNKLEILFRTANRKRLGVIKNTIVKTIDIKNTDKNSLRLVDEEKRIKLFGENDNKPKLLSCVAYTKSQFYERLDYLNQNDNRYYIKSDISKYEGKDIELFENRNNYHPWQLKLENLLFEKNGEFKEPNEREIIFILDEEGCSGKSTYWKYLLVKNNRELGLLSEANASQIKAALYKMGKRKLYVVDLPRTKSKMGVNDLINVLEQLKSGIVINNMYGQNDTLLIPPCHIVVSGNYLPYGSLSPDRWKVFKITNKNNIVDWIDISKEKQEEAKIEIEKLHIKEAIKKRKEDEFILKNLEGLNIEKNNRFKKMRESLKKSLVS